MNDLLNLEFTKTKDEYEAYAVPYRRFMCSVYWIFRDINTFINIKEKEGDDLKEWETEFLKDYNEKIENCKKNQQDYETLYKLKQSFQAVIQDFKEQTKITF